MQNKTIGNIVLSELTVERITEFVFGANNHRAVKIQVEYTQAGVSFFGVASGWIDPPEKSGRQKSFVYGQARGDTPDEAIGKAIEEALRSIVTRRMNEDLF